MKKIIYLLAFITLAGFLGSCSEDDLDSKSIFDTDPPVRNEFDKWILNNYTTPYNIDFKYKMEDIESSMIHNLSPAEIDKSIALAKLVKFLWLESYDEVAGVTFTRSYVPRVIHLIGSPAYENNGTMILGTAEGGLKVTLYLVNYLDVDRVSLNFLNTYYFKTMHHEFTHILTQTKNYDVEFDRKSEGDYVSGNWYQIGTSTALKGGFVSPYAMKEANEDFAENLSVYVTSTPQQWNALLNTAGADGSKKILEKFAYVKSYMSESWNIDIDQLRDVVQRRSTEIEELDLKNL